MHIVHHPHTQPLELLVVEPTWIDEAEASCWMKDEDSMPLSENDLYSLWRSLFCPKWKSKHNKDEEATLHVLTVITHLYIS